jgi:hypothetical protein
VLLMADGHGNHLQCFVEAAVNLFDDSTIVCLGKTPDDCCNSSSSAELLLAV